MRLAITTPTITLGSSTINVPVRVSVDPGFGINAAGGVPVVFGVDTGGAARRRDGRRLEDRVPALHDDAHVPVQPHGRSGCRLVRRPPDARRGRARPARSSRRRPRSRSTSRTSPSSRRRRRPSATAGLAVQAAYHVQQRLRVRRDRAHQPDVGAGRNRRARGRRSITLASGQSLGGQIFNLQASGAALGAQSVTLPDAGRGRRRRQDVPGRLQRHQPRRLRRRRRRLRSPCRRAARARRSRRTPRRRRPTCNAFNPVDYTITGLPAGFTLPGTVTVNAGAGITYPAGDAPDLRGRRRRARARIPRTSTSTCPKTGQSGNVPVTVNVSAGPDFTLGAAPNPITIPQGQTRQRRDLAESAERFHRHGQREHSRDPEHHGEPDVVRGRHREADDRRLHRRRQRRAGNLHGAR